VINNTISRDVGKNPPHLAKPPLTAERDRRIAANIAKLPELLTQLGGT
jgi:hypothetical protein